MADRGLEAHMCTHQAVQPGGFVRCFSGQCFVYLAAFAAVDRAVANSVPGCFGQGPGYRGHFPALEAAGGIVGSL